MNDLRLTGSVGSLTGNDSEDFKERIVRFRAQRQALLASNIANADTPGFKAKDIAFSDAMRGALSSRLAITSAGHVPFVGIEQSTVAFARYAVPDQPSMDNNTVDMNRERAAFAQNAILYQAAISDFAHEYKEFQLAASDPRR